MLVAGLDHVACNVLRSIIWMSVGRVCRLRSKCTKGLVTTGALLVGATTIGAFVVRCFTRSLRILKRPFEIDETLSNIINDWARGHHSLAALIDNSPLFSSKFAALVTADEHSVGAVRNLGHANHRFESISKPLGRCDNAHLRIMTNTNYGNE